MWWYLYHFPHLILAWWSSSCRRCLCWRCVQSWCTEHPSKLQRWYWLYTILSEMQGLCLCRRFLFPRLHPIQKTPRRTRHLITLTIFCKRHPSFEILHNSVLPTFVNQLINSDTTVQMGSLSLLLQGIFIFFFVISLPISFIISNNKFAERFSKSTRCYKMLSKEKQI